MSASELKPTIKPKRDPTKMMKAVTWQGKESLSVVLVGKPMITDPGDALIKITSSTICGSDLHLYHNEIPKLEVGDILGHEFMGVIEDIGPEVKDFQPGDRVVVAFPISCGRCYYCKQKLTSSCENTNPSKEMEALYGHRTGGIYGYSHMLGGWDGGQAEFIRVPFADFNLLKIPNNLKDEQVLFLSDIIATSWHANELAAVSEGDVVAVWGCGPVGLLACQWAKFRGAKRVIAVDGVASRLQAAQEKLGVEVVDCSKEDVIQRMQQLIPGGPDACIDAVGFRFPKAVFHKLQRALGVETDTPEVLAECITVCRKGGKIGVVGDYVGNANAFPIGAFMEKGLSMGAGQAPVQKYWHQLLEYIESGKFDATWLITHRMPLDDAPTAYKMFDKKEDNAIKILLKPSSMEAQ